MLAVHTARTLNDTTGNLIDARAPKAAALLRAAKFRWRFALQGGVTVSSSDQLGLLAWIGVPIRQSSNQ